jgi:hypothetical protein
VDADGKIIKDINRAVDVALARADLSHDSDKDRLWHGTQAPTDFKEFLEQFQRNRGILTPQYMECYKSEISFWYNSLSTGPTVPSDPCLNAGINPYK